MTVQCEMTPVGGASGCYRCRRRRGTCGGSTCRCTGCVGAGPCSPPGPPPPTPAPESTPPPSLALWEDKGRIEDLRILGGFLQTAQTWANAGVFL